MNKLLAMLLSSLLIGPALATPKSANQDGSGRKASQQEKTAACERHAKGMEGAERKSFMRRCMSMDAATDNQMEEIRACNNKAREKQGDERRAFLDKCMQDITNATAASGTLQDKSRPALQSPKP